MKRLSKSDISGKRRRRSAGKAEPEKSPSQDTADAPPAPAVQFEPLVKVFRDSIDKYHTENPHIRAYNMLFADDPSKAHLLNPEAARLFDQMYRQNPKDATALHHTAVIYHGNAFQMHQDESSMAKAVEYWGKGLKAWAGLIRDDEFWQNLKKRWEAKANKAKKDLFLERLMKLDLAAFQKQLPKHLLGLHASIIREVFLAKPNVAREHMRIILQSGFSQSEIQAVRRGIKAGLLGEIENLCQTLQFDKAQKLVTTYLEIDPTNVDALCDAIRVCTLQCEKTGASASKAARIQLMKKNEHRVKEKAIQDKLGDHHVGETVRHFYQALSEVYFAKAREDYGETDNSPSRLQDFKESKRFALDAIRADGGSHKSKKWFRVVCWVSGITAFNVFADTAEIKQLISGSSQHCPNDAGITALEAHCALEEGNSNLFRTKLKDAQKYQAVTNDPSDNSLITLLADIDPDCYTPRHIQKAINSASQALQRQDFYGALNQVSSLNVHSISSTDRVQVYFIRYLCQSSTKDIDNAFRSLFAAEKAIDGKTVPEVQKVVQNAIQQLKNQTDRGGFSQLRSRFG